MKRVLFAAAAVVAIVAAAPAGAHQTAKAPGPWCGGTLWKLMTFSDTGRAGVNLTPTPTSITALGAEAAPAKIGTARSAFEKQSWQITAVIERYRVASNGELVFEMTDPQSSTYMNAYMPNPKCLSPTTRDRAQILAARTAFTSVCPAPTEAWQLLGATVQLTGVGFFNPVKSTIGALANGAELRPVTGFTLMQGCGKD